MAGVHESRLGRGRLTFGRVWVDEDLNEGTHALPRDDTIERLTPSEPQPAGQRTVANASISIRGWPAVPTTLTVTVCVPALDQVRAKTCCWVVTDAAWRLTVL